MPPGLTVADSVQEFRAAGLALIDDSGPERTSSGTWILTDPEKVMVAATQEAIAEILAEVDQTGADLHWVALLNYELGFWFEPKLFHLRDFRHPPLIVICFRSAHWLSRTQFDGWLQEAVWNLPKSQTRAGIADLRVTNDLSTYCRAVRRILQHIGSGDCYQVGKISPARPVPRRRRKGYVECQALPMRWATISSYHSDASFVSFIPRKTRNIG